MAHDDLLIRKNADYVEFRHLHPSPIELKRKEHKVSMTVELDSDPEVLWNNFKTKHRTTIRRAEKNGLEIVRGGKEHLETFYKIISTGWRDLGTPIYRIDFFENIIRILRRFGCRSTWCYYQRQSNCHGIQWPFQGHRRRYVDLRPQGARRTCKPTTCFTGR